ncbi:MAG: nucleotidyltransferase family protein [Desulfobaccales bacterium]
MSSNLRTCLILAGGKGTRIKEAAAVESKVLLPIGGKPLISHTVGLVLELGIREVWLLLGPGRKAIQDHLQKEFPAARFRFFSSEEMVAGGSGGGLADAVACFAGQLSGPFMVMLGDEFYLGSNHWQMLQSQRDRPQASMIAVKPTDRPEKIRQNYAVSLNGDMRVKRVVEKPSELWNDLIGCGTYIFQQSIFQALAVTGESPRTGRRELTDALQVMIGQGHELRAFPLQGFYVNINRAQDLSEARDYWARNHSSEGD